MEPGLLLALSFLLTSAMIVVTLGASRFRKALMKEKPEVSLGSEEALLMPINGSVFLFSMYVLMRFIPKEHFNLMLSFYLSVISIFALAGFLKVYIKPNIFTGILCIAVGLGYFYSKNWILNNILAFAVGVTALEAIPLNNFGTSYLMLIALFLYDIFWVFGSDVMLTVASKIDGPIKFVFPKDITVNDGNFSLLGLGDMIVPGLFICQVRVFSEDVAHRGKVYFYGVVIAYFLSLLNTMGVMIIFQHGQPALLFIVPWLLITFSAMLVYYGDVNIAKNFDTSQVFKHKDETDTPAKPEEMGVKEFIQACLLELFGIETKGRGGDKAEVKEADPVKKNQ